MAAYLIKNKDTDDRLLVPSCRTVDLDTGAEGYLDETATVEATLLDRATQDEIAGETWPLALTYITGSDGDFHGPLRDTCVVTEFQQLDLQVVIDNGADQRRTLVLPCVVQVDRGA